MLAVAAAHETATAPASSAAAVSRDPATAAAAAAAREAAEAAASYTKAAARSLWCRVCALQVGVLAGVLARRAWAAARTANH
jgi:hypothetical protein